jgi:hypothetical protein
MSAYMNHGKTTSANRDSGRKSTWIGSKNHTTTATELNANFEDPVCTKLYDVSSTNPKATVGL